MVIQFFFQQHGYIGNGNKKLVNTIGDYWSSSLFTTPNNAYDMYFDSNTLVVDQSLRCYGFMIRPVKNE